MKIEYLDTLLLHRPDVLYDPEKFADYLDAKYHGKIKCRIPKVMEKIVIGE